jgi:hypothetical protein
MGVSGSYQISFDSHSHKPRAYLTDSCEFQALKLEAIADAMDFGYFDDGQQHQA